MAVDDASDEQFNNGLTDAYTLGWDRSFSKTIRLGMSSRAFKGTASVTLSGIATPVPLPGAIWFLGAGIMGVGAFLRRKRS